LALHTNKKLPLKLSFRVNQSPAFVFEHLSDMQKFVSVHPVITRMDSKGNGHYLVHETLRFLGIPFSFTYPVSIKINNQELLVIMQASVMKLVKIEMRFVVSEDNAFTRVEETIHFNSALPVKLILQGIFKKQHSELFKNLEKK
jgi:carbon monoxide dehydrogenase subunit G